MNFERLGFYPFSVQKIASFLSDFANIYFGIEIGGKSFMVIARIAIYNIQFMNFVEMVFCCISRKNVCYTRVKTATEYGCQTGFFKTILISPLPRILIFSLVQRFIIGSIQITATHLQTSIHDMQILIR
ncbi:MAG: hypothetical protein BWX65_00079 [Bacteroidetes bacterium ADurb.Bin057]|nr:MAG: hypothetical protein BWX65_00079 [Bacteroidetes bacterium ADurb.Bin057]